MLLYAAVQNGGAGVVSRRLRLTVQDGAILGRGEDCASARIVARFLGRSKSGQK